VNVELVHQIRPVLLHRARADEKLIGNVFDPVSFGKEFKDFALALGERLPDGVGGMGLCVSR
jgi:hypothetical protein